MKLVEICATYIEEWEEKWIDIQQASSTGILVARDNDKFGYALFATDIADDVSDFPLVTRAQWEAERARILAESQPERDPEIAEIVEKACGKRSKEDQALWDDIAKAHFKKVCTEEYSRFQFFAEIAFDAADEFMAERAKRMKG